MRIRRPAFLAIAPMQSPPKPAPITSRSIGSDKESIPLQHAANAPSYLPVIK
jgi:hypothetical protein